jgi:hypothetical protein
VQPKLEIAVTAAVSLCRTFCRLMAKGWMVKNKDGSEQGAVITLWLKDRYKEYLKSLCSLVNHGDAAVQVCQSDPYKSKNTDKVWGKKEHGIDFAHAFSQGRELKYIPLRGVLLSPRYIRKSCSSNYTL